MPTDAPAATVATGVLALPQLFAFEEIAWLREAAIAIAQREGAGREGLRFAQGLRFAPRDLHDVHRAEAGFRKLAAHPRLLERVRQAAGGPVTPRATRLGVGAGFEVPADASDAVSAVVFLDVGPGSRLGSALLVDGTASYSDPRRSDGTLAFVATFAWADARPEWIDAGLRAEADDCPWQTPFMAAG
jgi:hypothetical protein